MIFLVPKRLSPLSILRKETLNKKEVQNWWQLLSLFFFAHIYFFSNPNLKLTTSPWDYFSPCNKFYYYFFKFFESIVESKSCADTHASINCKVRDSTTNTNGNSNTNNNNWKWSTKNMRTKTICTYSYVLQFTTDPQTCGNFFLILFVLFFFLLSWCKHFFLPQKKRVIWP